MSGVYLILAGLAVFGFVPLIVILYKKNSVKRILTTGQKVSATVYGVYPIRRQATDVVYYSFYAQDGNQYTGSLTIKTGVYKQGDTLNISYLPSNPKRNTMQGAWGSNFIVGFGIAIALFVLFAVYKMHEMIQSGQM